MAQPPTPWQRVHAAHRSVREHWVTILVVLWLVVIPAILVIVMLITGYASSGGTDQCNPPYDISGCSG